MSLNFQSLKHTETTEDFRESVCAKFNTNLKQLEKDVQVLRDWLKQQSHLPQCSSDTMLKAYLLACKNNMEKAKTKLENYYVTRAELPEVFSDRDPTSEEMKDDEEIIKMYILPKQTPDGCWINMCGFTTTEAKKFNGDVYTKRTLMYEDIKMNMEAFVNGGYYVFDGKYLSMNHVMRITIRMCRNLIHCAQNVLPVRIKGVIFFNSPSYVEIVLNLLRPFLKGSKLLNRMHVHTGGPEELEIYFPKQLLPKDYGGEEDSSDQLHEAWMKCMKENREWFLNEGQLKADVNKNKISRQGKGEFEEMQGSFKSLCID